MMHQGGVGSSGAAGLTMLVIDTMVLIVVLVHWCADAAGQAAQDGGHRGDGGGQVCVSVVSALIRIIIVICQHHCAVHHLAELSKV